jgi:hypothetical protein
MAQGKLSVPLLCLFRATGSARIRKALSDQWEPSNVRKSRDRAALPCVGNALMLKMAPKAASRPTVDVGLSKVTVPLPR